MGGKGVDIVPNSWGTWPVVITMVVAIASPFITALVNNAHQKKMKNLELYTERRLSAIQEYLAASVAVSHYSTYENLDRYSHAYGNVQIFVTDEISEMMKDYDDRVAQKACDSDGGKRCWLRIRNKISSELLTQKDRKRLGL